MSQWVAAVIPEEAWCVPDVYRFDEIFAGRAAASEERPLIVSLVRSHRDGLWSGLPPRFACPGAAGGVFSALRGALVVRQGFHERANPSRGGDAKPLGPLLDEVAGLPKGGLYHVHLWIAILVGN